MTEADIRGHVKALKGGFDDDNEQVVNQVSIALVEQLLVDIHRIADALEYIATKKA
jgi:hypothetical protein